ncbi:g10026 [Coccomyxa viridis]|uniref:G10026 protein n=1 Tax=Coccomyxa viridis TaxID=1274662 RepID=A0ABP1G707_9CHLO
MAFNFGGASSTPGTGFNFGGASTPTTPAFGASNPIFGAAPSGQSQPASTPSLFGGFSTPAFGGAASTPAFGGGNSSAFGFGGASTPAFGAASTPAFGAAGASAPSLFGGTPAFGAASSSAFSFAGASTPAFGSTPNAFGAPTPQSAFGGGGLFGAPAQPQAQTQMAPTSFSGLPAQPDQLVAIKQLEAIKDAYQAAPNNLRSRFQHLFLNVVDNPASRVKPDGIDELQWREALQRAGGEGNAKNLWPVLALGTRDLLARKQAQDAAMREHKERLSSAGQKASQLVRHQNVVLTERVEQVRRRHREQLMQLLRVMRRVDLLESRFASALGHWPPQRSATSELERQLSALEGEMGASASGGLEQRVEALAAAARMQAGAAGGTQLANGSLNESSLNKTFGTLKELASAVSAIQGVLRRTDRDLSILDEELSGRSSDMAIVPSYA